ncbi:MAG: hypothetical protein JWN33_488 [Candidatus Saccharibacteria bacterium]|nr:hypothetical protein [Candidatus Saccharibacteria bacterium]
MVGMLNVILTLLAMIGLGIIIAFSPALFAAEIAVLSHLKEGRRQAVVLIIGSITPIMILAGLGVLIISPRTQQAVIASATTQQLFHWFDFALGLVLIIIGVVSLYSMRRRLTKKTLKKVSQPFKNDWFAFSFGFIRMMSNISSLAALLLALRLIKENLDSTILETFALALLLATTIAPYIALIYAKKHKPHRYELFERGSNKLLALDSRFVVSYPSLVIGVLLVSYVFVTFRS